MSEQTYRRLTNASLVLSDKKLYAYGNVCATSKSTATQKSVTTEFHVVRGTVSILPRRMASEDFALVVFAAADTYSVDVTTSSVGKLVAEYADHFRRIGKMHTPVKLHIDESVKSVHQKTRALEVFCRLSTSEATDYDRVKEVLHKRYNLTEDGYRQKFHTCAPEDGGFQTCLLSV